jgi:hypothetical protein
MTGYLVWRREEPRTEQVIIGHVGCDPPLERSATRARKLQAVAALDDLTHVAGQLTARSVYSDESIETRRRFSSSDSTLAWRHTYGRCGEGVKVYRGVDA